MLTSLVEVPPSAAGGIGPGHAHRLSKLPREGGSGQRNDNSCRGLIRGAYSKCAPARQHHERPRGQNRDRGLFSDIEEVLVTHDKDLDARLDGIGQDLLIVGVSYRSTAVTDSIASGDNVNFVDSTQRVGKILKLSYRPTVSANTQLLPLWDCGAFHDADHRQVHTAPVLGEASTRRRDKDATRGLAQYGRGSGLGDHRPKSRRLTGTRAS